MLWNIDTGLILISEPFVWWSREWILMAFEPLRERGKQELWKLVKSKGMQGCGKRRSKIKGFDEGNTLNA